MVYAFGVCERVFEVVLQNSAYITTVCVSLMYTFLLYLPLFFM